MKGSRSLHRGAAAAFAFLLVAAVGGCSTPSGPGSTPSHSYDPSAVVATPSIASPATKPPEPAATETSSVAAADPTATAFGGFTPIDVFASPTPVPPRNPNPTDPNLAFDPARPAPAQSTDWLTAKAAGRVALVGGRIVTLDASANPLAGGTGAPPPAVRTLDTSWSRWIVEPFGSGVDAKGSRYYDLNYWNLCGAGAATVALYYWQGLAGRPDVTGTSGYFIDPYASENVPWPSPGPSLPSSAGAELGTYWSGSDRVNGFAAHARGFIMYMAMLSQPPTWTATGIAVFANSSGRALYPTRGASRNNIEAGLNWEISGRNASSWVDAWYAGVSRADPTLSRDLQTAVTLDVGRDGVPVVVAVDTYELPNWQAGSATPHTRHAVTIVGYDNTTTPPTYTYIDTCGRSCNSRGGNENGQIHVIAQSKMVAAIGDRAGSGFVW